MVGMTDPRDVNFETPRVLVVLKSNLTVSYRARAPDGLCHFTMVVFGLWRVVRIPSPIPQLVYSSFTNVFEYHRRQQDAP